MYPNMVKTTVIKYMVSCFFSKRDSVDTRQTPDPPGQRSPKAGRAEHHAIGRLPEPSRRYISRI